MRMHAHTHTGHQSARKQQRCRVANQRACPTSSPPAHLPPGAKFFPGFVSDRRRAALDDAALGWQAEGRSRLAVLDRMKVSQDHAVLLAAAGGHRGSAVNTYASCRVLLLCVCTAL